MRTTRFVLLVGAVALFPMLVAPAAAGQAAPASAQPGPGEGRGGGAPAIVSPEVSADRRITFRINAPQAKAVRVSGGDIPGLGQNGVMTRGENGVWTFTSAPVPPGAYRYNVNVDGVAVIDPRNPLTSVSNNNVWSLALVPGIGHLRHEGRAARGGGQHHLLFRAAQTTPPYARLHAAGL